jgi:hypothetical protein
MPITVTVGSNSSPRSGSVSSVSGVAVSTAPAAAVRLVVEPQGVDPRSSQVQFSVRLENPAGSKIRVLALRPLIPPGAEVQQVIDSSLSGTELERKNLHRDLEILVTGVLIESSEEYRKRISNNMKKTFRDLLTIRSMFDIYVNLFFKRSVNYIIKYTETHRAWQVDIRNIPQAKQLYDEILAPREDDLKEVCLLYRSKMDSLGYLDEGLSEDASGNRIADVEPGGVFARTYIFSCERNLLNPQIYNFAFDCSYEDETDKGREQRSLGASVAATVSPKPLVLNLLAMTSALLGAVLKIALDATRPVAASEQATGGAYPIQTLGDQIASLITLQHCGLFIASMITALFFYNIYDSTDIGKKINVGTGWRSALLIGGLSGLLNERVIAALRGLLG